MYAVQISTHATPTHPVHNDADDRCQQEAEEEDYGNERRADAEKFLRVGQYCFNLNIIF